MGGGLCPARLTVSKGACGGPVSGGGPARAALPRTRTLLRPPTPLSSPLSLLGLALDAAFCPSLLSPSGVGAPGPWGDAGAQSPCLRHGSPLTSVRWHEVLPWPLGGLSPQGAGASSLQMPTWPPAGYPGKLFPSPTTPVCCFSPSSTCYFFFF